MQNNSITSSNKCPFHIGPLKDEKSFIIAADLFKKPIEELINNDIGKWRNSINEIEECFGDIHNMIRNNYKLSQHRSGMNIYPLIIASEEGNPSDPFNYGRQGIGGVYTLYKSPNEVYKYCPVHPIYEILKVSNHLILGIFVIIEPYLQFTVNHKGVKRLRFIKKLIEYNSKLKIALNTVQSMHDEDDINKLFINDKTKILTESILLLSINYCNSVINEYDKTGNGNIDLNNLMTYSKKIKPMIKKGMKMATDYQAKGVIDMLLKWKSIMTDKEWKNLYVVIPTVWVTSKNNPREQLFRLIMDKNQQDTHIIIGENITSEYQARVLCGRVVHDRIMSRFIFGIDDIWSQRKCQGLGSQTDSLMDYARNSIKDYVRKYSSNQKANL